MRVKNRYVFIKRTFPNTIVIFEKNNEYKSYGQDKELLEYIKFKKLNNLNKLKINYIVVRNMTIVKHEIFENSMYQIYYTRFNLFKLVNLIRQRRR